MTRLEEIEARERAAKKAAPGESHKAVSDFYAHAASDIPYLLKRVRELEDLVARIEDDPSFLLLRESVKKRTRSELAKLEE